MSLQEKSSIGIHPAEIWMSYDGKVQVGGLDIVKVSRADFETRFASAVYYELGEREGEPYVGQPAVTGTISRAHVNMTEWQLALGKAPNEQSYIPGLELDDISSVLSAEGVTDTSAILGRQTQNDPRILYPVKTQMKFIINKNGIPNVVNAQGGRVVKKIEATLFGVIIDSGQVAVGKGIDLITSGPISFVAEKTQLKVIDG